MLSWSLLNAMASGCVVLASDVPPVREVIEPGQNGLVEPLFDVERLTETALRVLDDPAAFAPLGRAAAATVEEKLQPRSLHPAAGGLLRAGGEPESAVKARCSPALMDVFEQIATVMRIVPDSGKWPSVSTPPGCSRAITTIPGPGRA